MNYFKKSLLLILTASLAIGSIQAAYDPFKDPIWIADYRVAKQTMAGALIALMVPALAWGSYNAFCNPERQKELNDNANYKDNIFKPYYIDWAIKPSTVVGISSALFATYLALLVAGGCIDLYHWHMLGGRESFIQEVLKHNMK